MLDNCFLCHKYGPVERHHVFQGAYRKKAEQHGFVVRLCRECHTGKDGVHSNKEKRIALRQRCQRDYEKTHTREQFIAEFGRNYLED
jgi:hypothetical protein